MDYLNKRDISSAKFPNHQVVSYIKESVRLTDWSEFAKYVMDNDAIHLVQRRVTQSEVKALLQEGVQVPGVQTFAERKLRITKSK
jgi:hypothetical protein